MEDDDRDLVRRGHNHPERTRPDETARLDRRYPSTVADTEIVYDRGIAQLDFLRHHRPADLDVFPAPAADDTSGRARAFSGCQSLRTVWRDDSGPVRDRVPGFRRWKKLDALSVPPQASGTEGPTWNLRPLPAAIRLEPLVCFARRMAGLSDCDQHGSALAVQ